MAFILQHEHAASMRKMLKEEFYRQRQNKPKGFDEIMFKDFINGLGKMRPEDETRTLICAWADGCLYGNWPWINIQVAAS